MPSSLDRQSNIAFLIGYVALFYLMGLMLWPYLSALVFGGILAGTFYPMKKGMQSRFGMGNGISAIFTFVLMICTIFVPCVYLIVELTVEAVSLFEYLQQNFTEELIEQILFGEGLFGDAYIPKILEEVFRLFNLDYNVQTIQTLVLDSATGISSYVLETVNSWVSNILSFVVEMIIMLVMILAILVQGDQVKSFLLRLSPLPTEEEELVITKFNQMNFVTMVGNGIGGIIQGGLAGACFWYMGFESVVLWTTTMVVFAFIPMVGISFVYIPASIYLLIIGKPTDAAAMFIFCTIVALVVEQWFKPRFVGNRVKINSTLVFLSIIGGMSVFGLLGIFYGPLIISIFLTFVELYHKRYTIPAEMEESSAFDHSIDQDTSFIPTPAFEPPPAFEELDEVAPQDKTGEAMREGKKE